MIGNFAFSVLLIAVLWATAMYVAPDMAFSMTGVMMFATMFALALSFSAMASLITAFVTKREVLSGIQSVIPLGLSFISGTFFDAALLSEGILNIAKLFPTYWYAQSIERIGLYEEYGAAQWGEVLGSIGIILAFGVGYYVLLLIVSNLKRIRNKNN